MRCLAENYELENNTVNLLDRFQQQAARTPDRPALITAKAQSSFSELERRSAQAAQMLSAKGLRAGDVALVFQPMSVCLYEVLLALFRLGMVALFVDPQAGRDTIVHAVARCRPKALIACHKAQWLRLLSPAVAAIPHKLATAAWFPGATSWQRLAAYAPAPEVTDVDDDHPALITFTSGATGRPKAALRTHGFLCRQHRVLEKHLDLRPGQLDLTTLPVFVLANLGSGVTSLIPDANLLRPGHIRPARVLRQIRQYRPQRSAGSPAFYLRLAQAVAVTGETLPQFETIYTGGAPVYPRTLDALRKMAPRARLVAVYGSTEAEPIAHLDDSQIDTSAIERMHTGHGLLAGTPVDDIELKIIRMQWGQAIATLTAAEFHALQLPAGQTGEIVVSGAHVLPGYLDGIGDQETKFAVEGRRWHRTGDAGYLDHRHRLWLMGRCSARLQDTDGELYPFAVEAAALQQHAVRHAALIQDGGRRLLVIECHKGRVVDHDRLLQTLRWAKIDRIREVRKIPMDKRHNAKVDYPALYRQLRCRDTPGRP